MPRSFAYVTALALGLVLGPLSGVPAAADYELGAEDKLNITVYEWPDLTGTFTVGASGVVAMPMLGSVAAAGLTPEALAEEIARRLQERAGLPEAPGASVEVAEYRPFFILGDVQTPGEYPFRPGLTVLQAVSVGGGHFRYTDPGLLRLEREAIASRGDLRILARQIDQYHVRRARLNAEMEEADAIALPPEIEERKEDSDIARLIREESILFETRRDTLQEQITTLESLITLYENEIVSLEAQLDTERRQSELLDLELDSVRSLVERGLAPSPRQLALERNAAEIEREQRELETYILRAHQNISQSRQNIVSLRSERRNEIVTELQQTQAMIAEAGERVSTTQQLILESEVTAPMERVRQDLIQASQASYAIIRRNDEGEAEEIAAEETSPVLPGDVVQVQRRIRASQPEAASEAGTRTGALDPDPRGQAAVRNSGAGRGGNER